MSINNARAILERAAQNPQAAPEAVAAALRELGGDGISFPELDVSGLIRLAGVAQIAAASGPGAPTDSPRYNTEWPGGNGMIRSIFVGTLDGADTTLSAVSVRIAVNGTEEMFTDGNNAAFVPLRALQPNNHQWTKLRNQRVSPQSKWMVQFRNEGATAVTPYILFGYVRLRQGA